MYLSSPVVVEPGSVAGYDDVMSLLGHVVLVEVRAFHWFTLHAWRAFLLLLLEHKRTLMLIYSFTGIMFPSFPALLQTALPFLLFPWTHPLARLFKSKNKGK